MTHREHIDLNIRFYARQMSEASNRNRNRKRWLPGDRKAYQRALDSLIAWKRILREWEDGDDA